MSAGRLHYYAALKATLLQIPVWVDSGTSSSHHATDRLTPHSCYSKDAKFNGMTCWNRPIAVLCDCNKTGPPAIDGPV